MGKEKPRDSVRRLAAIEALERDVIAALSKPVTFTDFWVDLERAQEFTARRSGVGPQRVTLMHLLIKAAALALPASPELARMYGRFRVLEPDRVDVGVSVDAGTIVAPVVVIEGADRRPLADIAGELRERSVEARSEAERLKTLARRYLWLVPLPWLRRVLIRAYLSSPRRRRRAVGSIQLSSLERFGLEVGNTPVVAELLLMCGAVHAQVRADEAGGPVVRTGAVFTLHGSHRKVNGLTAGAFVDRFRSLLADPEQLA